MNGETGFLHSFVAMVPEDPRGARHWRILVSQTSHEDNWCQASIALPHRNLLPLLVGLRVSSGSFFS